MIEIHDVCLTGSSITVQLYTSGDFLFSLEEVFYKANEILNGHGKGACRWYKKLYGNKFEFEFNKDTIGAMFAYISREDVGLNIQSDWIEFFKAIRKELGDMADEVLGKYLKDSGARTTYKGGAMREIIEENGRCDLMPLDMLFEVISAYDHGESYTNPLIHIDRFHKNGDYKELLRAIISMCHSHNDWNGDPAKMFLDVSKHYKQGAMKYGERNWEKGLPIHSFIDSGVRHYLKWLRDKDSGTTDEPHDRAFIWNMLGAAWTMRNHPDMDDYTMPRKVKKDAD